MIKRKGGSQIKNLTPDHKPFESRGQMNSDWGVLYTIGNIFLRAIKYCHQVFHKKNFDLRNIWTSKVLGQQKSQF
jgi:hypothetical protein